MFGVRNGDKHTSPNGCRFPGRESAAAALRKLGWVEILPTGEEEVKVAKSEAPEITGAWCKREMLRSR
ncbi:hypothetical protein GCM10010271_16670 [Streptomyces kurssanovii]|nr:hypothetical protein GCM10010271_16670 [Streptomyces kurssanovii]